MFILFAIIGAVLLSIIIVVLIFFSGCRGQKPEDSYYTPAQTTVPPPQTVVPTPSVQSLPVVRNRGEEALKFALDPTLENSVIPKEILIDLLSFFDNQVKENINKDYYFYWPEFVLNFGSNLYNILDLITVDL